MFDIFVAISRWLTASCLHHLPQFTWYAARSSICTNTFVFPPVVFTVLKPVNCQILTNVYFWHFFSGRHIVTWFCVLWATVRQTPVKASGPQASLRKIHKTSNAKHDKPRPFETSEFNRPLCSLCHRARLITGLSTRFWRYGNFYN